MKKLVLLSAVLFGTVVASQAGVHLNIGIGFPFPRSERVVISRPAPHCAPTPVYVAPPPYCPPPRVIYAPPHHHYSHYPQHGHHGWGDRDRGDYGRDRHHSHRR